MSRMNKIDIPVTMMTTQYFLSEIAVFRTTELRTPQLSRHGRSAGEHSWLGVLMHKTWINKQPNVPLNGTLDIVKAGYEGWSKPRPGDPIDHI